MAAIFDIPLTSMSESVCISPTELLDPKNVGSASGISLLSSIEGAYCISYNRPVMSVIVECTYPDIEAIECLH